MKGNSMRAISGKRGAAWLLVFFLAALFSLAVGVTTAAQDQTEVQQLKSMVESLQKTVQQLNQRIAVLEQEKTAAPQQPAAQQPVPAPQAQQVQPETPTIPEGHASPVTLRDSFSNEQAAAPRLNDLTVDPKYQGFIRIPNSPVIMQFNAKPHLDMMEDDRNTGDKSRFVTALIPVEGSPDYGGGSQFNINAKATNLSWDVRAPGMEGSPRFFVQADFFGSENPKLDIRWKQLYAEYYNFVFGQTITLFEDPDVWPDTVDYEGPNSMIFARQPVIHYLIKLSPQWNMTLGLEKADAQIASYYGQSVTGVSHIPDLGLNIRWEKAHVGHVQFAAMFRDLTAQSPVTHLNEDAFGWGANLSWVFDVGERDSLLGQLTYGEGIGRYSNDAFSNMDAAFNNDGNLKALPYFGGFFGYTHGWSPKWRSTLTYGYVDLQDELSMGPTAYHRTNYASLNAVYQFRKKMSLGMEVLYGRNQLQDLSKGDAWRLQFGIAYRLF
jgi:hypothetical protein